TEVEVPLAPRRDWRDAVVAFGDFMDCARAGDALARRRSACAAWHGIPGLSRRRAYPVRALRWNGVVTVAGCLGAPRAPGLAFAATITEDTP
ncbi:hypothetical protein, partial [Falsiroseomonas oryziterrae]|uniref:hypothetical protein n=1 Tax=Falsiroseomonas oryziterrae TaxID=2911368 RepID=UPI001F2C58EF